MTAGGSALSSLVQLFFQGWMVGLFMSLPLGPVGMLCFRQVVFRGFTFGLAAGLGVALADSLFGVAAGFGIEFLGEALLPYHTYCKTAGAIFLLSMGVWSFIQSKRPLLESKFEGKTSIFYALLQAFFVTLANPMALIGFSALFVLFGVDLIPKSKMSLSALVSGVFLGSFLSLSLFVFCVSFLKKRLEPHHFTWVFRQIFRLFSAFFLIGGLFFLFLGYFIPAC